MNERKMILKMLNEGKITLEEADALLEALELAEPDQDELFDAPTLEKPVLDEGYKEVPPESETKQQASVDEVNVDEHLHKLDDQIQELDAQIEALDLEIEKVDDEFDFAEESADILTKQELKEKKRLIKEKRQAIKRRRKEIKEQKKVLKKQDKAISFDFQEGIDEISRGFEELKKNFQGEGMTELKSTVKDIAGQINQGVKELSKGIGEGTKEVRKAFNGKDFKKMFGNLFKSIGFGPTITLEEEFVGNLDSSKESVVDLKTFNGRLEVIGTDESAYKLKLEYSIRAEDEAEANRMKAEMCTVTQQDRLLKVEVHQRGFFGSAVRVKLYIPKNTNANFKLKTSNGRIKVYGLKNHGLIDMTSSNGQIAISDLWAKEINCYTSNGRIELKDYAADRVDVHTSNGGIYLDGLCDQINGQTSNGTITVYPYVNGKGNLDLKTSNGRIKVIVRDQELGIDIDATTHMGSINLDLPDLVYQQKIEKTVKRKYQAQTKDYIGKEKRVQVLASTSNGSIYVGEA